MSYIAPSTKIYLLSNVPLDPTYEHTIWFNNETEQRNYFLSKVTYQFDNQSYQRVKRGYLRIEGNAENYYLCNYLMFKNYRLTANEKWFYAFIKSVEYINENVTEIEFELDVMQTWFFNYELEQCFVEREHSATDAIGDNTVPENIETGEYITNDSNMLIPTDFQGLSICIWSTINRSYTDQYGMYHQGMYSSLNPIDFPLTAQGCQDAADWVNNLPIFKADAIVSACILPTSCLPGKSRTNEFHVVGPAPVYRQDGHAVRNNKLYTYPYSFISITNNEGDTKNYKYELFYPAVDNRYEFYCYIDCSPSPSGIILPVNYKVTGQSHDISVAEEALTICNYPQIGFNIDAFKAWLAQNAVSLAAKGIVVAAAFGATEVAGAATASASLSEGVAAYAVGSVLAGAAGALASPPKPIGKVGGGAMVTAGWMCPLVSRRTVRPEYATIIDDYFQKFGYACRKMKVPNRHVRNYWTYTKTISCQIVGSLPHDTAEKICSIYNHGITFWTNERVIGNYNLDNAPL